LILKTTGGEGNLRKIKPEAFSSFQSNRNLAVGIDKRDLFSGCGTVPKEILLKKGKGVKKCMRVVFST